MSWVLLGLTNQLVPSLPSIPGWSRAGPSKSSKTNDESPSTDDQSDDEDLDKPPQFPLPDSAQRSQAPKSPVQPPPPLFNVLPPSPNRARHEEEPPSDLNIAILPDPIPLGNMAPPPSTTSKPTFGLQVGGDDSSRPVATLGAGKSKGKRGKVALGPGFSALDWNRLTSSGKDLKGTGVGFLRVTMEELKKHNKRDDAWAAFNGRVYNITSYLPFHPGGVDEIMRVAGRDGTKLFMLTHSWVNLDYMLQECMVGMLVRG